jgi:hypothetical protein
MGIVWVVSNLGGLLGLSLGVAFAELLGVQHVALCVAEV